MSATLPPIDYPRTLPVSSVGITTMIMVSHAWWGIFHFDVVLRDKNRNVLLSGTTQKFINDSDDDGIADVWELEEENGGSLNLNSAIGPSADPSSCPDTGGQDACWDGEITGSAYNGDGFTKMEEYQGVMVGSDHHRLFAEVPEILLDISDPVQEGGQVELAAQWAAGELPGQLGIEPHADFGIDGLKNEPRFPGNKMLERLGEGAGNPTRGYVRLEAANVEVPNPGTNFYYMRRNGLIANDTHYYWNNTAVKDDATCDVLVPDSPNVTTCQPLGSWYDLQRSVMDFGHTESEVAPGLDGYWVANIYDGTIANLFDGNVITESVTNHMFWWSVADVTLTRSYNAFFNDADVDNQNGKTAANPFVLLFRRETIRPLGQPTRSILNNNLLLDRIAGTTKLDALKRSTLHELGHAVGIWVEDGSGCSALLDLPTLASRYNRDSCHPEDYPSVMRSGIGPGKVDSFTSDDKKTINLRR